MRRLLRGGFGGAGGDFFGGRGGVLLAEVQALGVEGGWRVFQPEPAESVDQDGGDGHVAEGLVVRGDDEPGRVLVAGVAEDLLVGVAVSGPEGALSEVGGRELPALVRGVDARLEAAGLLGAGDVQVELEDDGSVGGEGVLPVVDLAQAAADGLFIELAVDARDQDILIVRAVEDADHAAGGKALLAAPEEVMLGFERGGRLEAGDVAALRVDAGEDVADGAVFAGGVHALQHDEHSL